jgi:two-component system cell cycle response regulator DivK
MPGLDGFAVLEDLRRDARTVGICVVALTASGMCGDREKALACGFDGYLIKPIGIAALRREVGDRLNFQGAAIGNSLQSPLGIDTAD